ncbi:MAG TPA: hypothetical protein VFM02_04615 [Candidatus Paceibacterota bacterium]|nr:hypothetical protein [Candidatus Paceibacterota bacterium]
MNQRTIWGIIIVIVIILLILWGVGVFGGSGNGNGLNGSSTASTTGQAVQVGQTVTFSGTISGLPNTTTGTGSSTATSGSSTGSAGSSSSAGKGTSGQIQSFTVDGDQGGQILVTTDQNTSYMGQNGTSLGINDLHNGDKVTVQGTVSAAPSQGQTGVFNSNENQNLDGATVLASQIQVTGSGT